MCQCSTRISWPTFQVFICLKNNYKVIYLKMAHYYPDNIPHSLLLVLLKYPIPLINKIPTSQYRLWLCYCLAVDPCALDLPKITFRFNDISSRIYLFKEIQSIFICLYGPNLETVHVLFLRDWYTLLRAIFLTSKFTK